MCELDENIGFKIMFIFIGATRVHRSIVVEWSESFRLLDYVF